MLQVPDSSVDHLERIRRRSGAEIIGFDECHRIATKRRLPCRTCGERSTTDDKYVKFLASDRADIPSQADVPMRNWSREPGILSQVDPP